MQPSSPLLLYDGVCGLCHGVVQWLIRHDRARVLRYAPLQGETAAEMRACHPQIPRELESVVLIEADQVYLRADAFIRLARWLPFPWSLGAWLRIVPRPLRDLGYDVVARIRYRVFGRHDVCTIPSPEQRERFLP